MKMYCSEGANINKCYSLDEGVILVGRSSINDIVIKDSACSRKHAIIIVDNNIPYIVSVKTDNPVLLDNAPVFGKERLNSGQTITIGSTIFNVIGKREAKPVVCENTHNVMNADVREALREIMNNDLYKLSSDRTTRIISDELISA